MPTLDNPKHEQFAQLIVVGESQAAAYAIAFGNRSAGAMVNASKLANKPAVAARITELRETMTAKNPVLTLEKKREYLREAVLTPVGKIDENSPLCQSYKVSTRTDRDGATIVEKSFEAVGKLRALELDAKLAGEIDAGGRPTVCPVVNIALLGMSLPDLPEERPAVVDVEVTLADSQS